MTLDFDNIPGHQLLDGESQVRPDAKLEDIQPMTVQLSTFIQNHGPNLDATTRRLLLRMLDALNRRARELRNEQWHAQEANRKKYQDKWKGLSRLLSDPTTPAPKPTMTFENPEDEDECDPRYDHIAKRGMGKKRKFTRACAGYTRTDTMTTEDKFLTCGDCGSKFLFSVGEQRFFAARDFQPPKRCPKCRARQRQIREREEAACECRS